MLSVSNPGKTGAGELAATIAITPEEGLGPVSL
jgi:hypothetical protein